MVAHALNLSNFGGRNRKISAFEASLVYLKRSGTVRAMQRPCLKHTKLSSGVIPKSGLTLRPASLKGKRKEGLVHLGRGEKQDAWAGRKISEPEGSHLHCHLKATCYQLFSEKPKKRVPP